MRAFQVNNGTPEEFVARVERALAEDGLEEYVSVQLEGEELAARFRWLGVSELRYRVAPTGDGFRAVLETQDVSVFHVAFRGPFEERFDQVLARVGAKSV